LHDASPIPPLNNHPNKAYTAKKALKHPISMSDYPEIEISQPQQSQPKTKKSKLWLTHGGLFMLTFASVSYAGILWVGRSAVHQDFWGLMADGALFATLLLGFLGVHEFGHYFAARFHKIAVSLPYFIPVPFLGIGTLGAVIRIKEPIQSTKKLFDIGIAGPLAGFVVALGFIIYGLISLPDASFINQFEGHEAIKAHVAEYGVYPENPPSDETETIFLGNTILFSFLTSFQKEVPPMWELYHYPFLFVGWLGLFFTALNLTPVGQLDGGHILYGLIGRKGHQWTSKAIIFILSILAGLGAMGSVMIQDPFSLGGSFLGVYWIGWALGLVTVFRRVFKKNQTYVILATALSMATSGGLLWAKLVVNPESYLMWLIWLVFLTFFAGAGHPPVIFPEKLNKERLILGWSSMVIYVLCFTVNPIYSLIP
jgi:hypothetical protein